MKRIGSFLAVVLSVAVTAIPPAMAAKAPKNAAPKEESKMNPTTLQTPTAKPSADEAIRPFQVHFSEEALADLRRRILATHWPDKETVPDATQGVQLATMQRLAKYWATE